MIVREAVASDAKGMAKVHVDSWRTTYKGVVPDDYLDNLSYQERENIWNQAIPRGGVYVAEVDGKVVGFANGGKERSGNYADYDGELYAIYILKEYQGQGIGKELMTAVANHLVRQGYSNMLVIVLEDNPAKHFYESTGAKYVATGDLEISGKKLIELVYGWENLKNVV